MFKGRIERTVSLYPKLIFIGNNVHPSVKVLLVPHDTIYLFRNNLEKSSKIYKEKMGNNVIIDYSRSVTLDIPDNSIVVGIPAKAIRIFDEFVNQKEGNKCIPIN